MRWSPYIMLHLLAFQPSNVWHFPCPYKSTTFYFSFSTSSTHQLSDASSFPPIIILFIPISSISHPSFISLGQFSFSLLFLSSLMLAWHRLPSPSTSTSPVHDSFHSPPPWVFPPLHSHCCNCHHHSLLHLHNLLKGGDLRRGVARLKGWRASQSEGGRDERGLSNEGRKEGRKKEGGKKEERCKGVTEGKERKKESCLVIVWEINVTRVTLCNILVIP